MSNRLESLNSKKPAGKPALKFKPKAVARKSKEDRDKDAALIKSEDKPMSPAPSRGRGGARGRGGRGRGASYVGTHVVSAGPLASGSVSMGGTTSSKTGLTNDKIYGADSSLNAAAVSNLKLKNRKLKSPTPLDQESEEEDDPTKINMSKEYLFEDSETLLFPVRPHKDTPAPGQSIPPSVTVLVNSSRAVTAETVKSEVLDDVAESTPGFFNDPIERAEHDKRIDDQHAIVDLLTSNMANLKADEESPEVPPEDSKYILFHIPQVLAKEDNEVVPKSNFASQSVLNFEGHIGNLNFHKSGKISMTLGGGTVFDVTQGMPTTFLQEVFVVDSHEARKKPEDEENEMVDLLDADGGKIGGNIFRLGEVAGKLIATPALP
ncbi:CIC11C00000003868 [Sungouiella intermedia]|uniref:CIC11C00000003868 n=1 Tax=Sungouiella intermedia TaxID=45354 RepID=A0A1L0BG52_9ASCO|nr:CIC11C00000003868 [[Candida] intermedia]